MSNDWSGYSTNDQKQSRENKITHGRKKTLEQIILTALDSNRDDQITFDEAEGSVLEIVDKAGMAIKKINTVLTPFKNILTFGFGTFICFYGKNFTYTILFLQVFRVSGWPTIKKGLIELKESYWESREELKKKFPVLVKSARSTSSQESDQQQNNNNNNNNNNTIKEEEEEESSLVKLGSCIDSTKVSDIIKGLYSGVVACMACAMSGAAAKIGIGMNIGTIISRTVNETIRPFTRKQIVKLSEKHEKLANQNVQNWIDFGIYGVLSIGTIITTYYFEKTMFTVANSLTGAEIMVKSLSRIIESSTQLKNFIEKYYYNNSNNNENNNNNYTLVVNKSIGLAVLQYSLGAFGIYYQILRGGGKIPNWISRSFLLFPLLFEKSLAALASAIRV